MNYSSSFLVFLENSKGKVANILYRLSEKRYANSSAMLTDDVDYITFRNDGSISYLPKGKVHQENDDGTWKREGRQTGRAAKVIRRMFTKRILSTFKDSDFECFSNQYKSTFSEDGYKFQLLDNSSVKRVYSMYRKCGDSSLSSSCMNERLRYLDVYENCKSLQILVMTNEADELCGRALVWDVDGIVLMDRVYVAMDFLYESFLTECKKRGWWRKGNYKGSDRKTLLVNEKGDEVDKKLVIYTDTNFEYFPYIDTFTYGDDGALYNYENRNDYTYENTDGSRIEHTAKTWDDIDECYIEEYDAVYLEDGYGRYSGCYTHIDNCVQINRGWYHIESDSIVKVDNMWYLKDDEEVCYCEKHDEYYLAEDCVYIEETGTMILLDEAVEIDGIYYDKESDSIVVVEGEWKLKPKENE